MLYAYVFAAVLVVLVAMGFCQNLSKSKTIEGLPSGTATSPACQHCNSKAYNEPPLGENPLYLAALNSANIQYLQDKLKDYQKVKEELEKVQKGENHNAKALAKIAYQMQSALGKNAPKHPAKITRHSSE